MTAHSTSTSSSPLPGGSHTIQCKHGTENCHSGTEGCYDYSPKICNRWIHTKDHHDKDDMRKKIQEGQWKDSLIAEGLTACWNNVRPQRSCSTEKPIFISRDQGAVLGVAASILEGIHIPCESISTKEYHSRCKDMGKEIPQNHKTFQLK